ncbi:MAG: WXG100 family type VII secretion target [Mycobacteriales bacterium]
MTYYRLEVDPDPLEQAVARLRRAGRALEEAGTGAAGEAAGWSAGWRGDTATAAAAEAAGLALLLSQGASALDGAARSLDRLADAYRQALEMELPSLDRRREAALAARNAAEAAAQASFSHTMSAVPSGLRGEVLPTATAARRRQLAAAAAEETADLRAVDAAYDELVERLRARTAQTGAALAADPPVPVPQLAVAAYGLPGPFGAIAFGLLDAATALAGRLPLGVLSVRLQNPPSDPAELAALLDEARAAGLPPTQYRAALEAHWLAQALAAAGISPARWDPSLGAEANREIIEAVYAYYGRLYLDDPDLQWAGMAAMIGPSFAGGFLDLAMLRGLPGQVPAPLRRALPPGVSELAELTAGEIAFYEQTLLQMQQDIFFDQGVQHQAYLDGGLPALEELAAAGLLRPESLTAWRDIAGGDPVRVSRGNAVHLRREQYEIIGETYDQMRNRFPTGPVVTWAMTFAGSPSIPDARSYPDVFPATLAQGTPGPRRIPLVGWDNPLQVTVEVETPFPAGNISVRDERWELIVQDTLPAFRELIENDPVRARALLEQPVGQRIEQFRLSERWPELVAQLADWDVEVRQ